MTAYFAKQDKIGVAPFVQYNIDFNDCNSRLDILELQFIEDDNAIHLFMSCHEVSEGKKPDDWKSGHLVYAALHKTKYNIWNLKESKAEEIEPTLLETLLIKHFQEKLDDEKTYKGFLVLNSMPAMLEQIKNGVLTLETLAMVGLIEEPTPSKLPQDLPIPKAKGKGSWGGSKGQSELERLNDRVKFITESLADSSPIQNLMIASGIPANAMNPTVIIEYAMQFIK